MSTNNIPTNRETIANILRDAVLYSALVAVGGSWATFIRESALTIIPEGIVGEVVAVTITTLLGVVVAILSALSLRLGPSTVNTLPTPASKIEQQEHPQVKILMRDSVTAKAMRPKGLYVPHNQVDAHPKYAVANDVDVEHHRRERRNIRSRGRGTYSIQ